MSQKIVNGYHISVYIEIFICFFYFYRKANMYTVGIYVIVFCQKYLKI